MKSQSAMDCELEHVAAKVHQVAAAAIVEMQHRAHLRALSWFESTPTVNTLTHIGNTNFKINSI